MATEIKAINASQFAQSGSIGKFAIKIEGMVGTTSATVVNVTENPFGEDMLILEAYVAITALDSTDADMDIGLADSVTGSNYGSEIVDSFVNSAKVIHTFKLHTPAVTGVSFPIWKAANSTRTAVDSWIASYQNGSSDSADLVYNLILVLAREADFN